MHQSTFGTVKGGVVVPAATLPEGAPVEVYVLGAPPDVLLRVRRRPILGWLETALESNSPAGHKELIDIEVPAILRHHDAEGLFAEVRSLMLRHFPSLVSLEVQANENRDAPGSVWFNIRAELPAGTDPLTLRSRLTAFDREWAAAGLSRPGLLLLHEVGVAGD